EMADSGYTIVAPQMSPIHFQFFKTAFATGGHDVMVLDQCSDEVVKEGLTSVHNDACYPSILVVGQLIHAVRSGRVNPDKCALAITQTGGGCRATNYVAFIRKALRDAGLAHIPVLALSAQGIETNSGFKIKAGLLKRIAFGLLYGDILERVLYRVRPYEVTK
ncbi:2-hydroxyglutaryl-CoA dehydratase, D-component, partial [Kipferlia bialata]